MSSMPQCVDCGHYVHHGGCLCEDDAKKLKSENKRLRDALKEITCHQTKCESSNEEFYYNQWLSELYEIAQKALKDPK